jgi:hypothetical protein
VENFVHDPWLVRRLSALAGAAGFEVSPVQSYGIVETLEPSLTPTWVDRGAEARRHAAERSWFGYMAYASLIARKPA